MLISDLEFTTQNIYEYLPTSLTNWYKLKKGTFGFTIIEEEENEEPALQLFYENEGKTVEKTYILNAESYVLENLPGFFGLDWETIAGSRSSSPLFVRLSEDLTEQYKKEYPDLKQATIQCGAIITLNYIPGDIFR